MSISSDFLFVQPANFFRLTPVAEK